MKMLLISNMYPSNTDVTYGNFVRNFKQQMEYEGVDVNKIVIKGKGRTKFEKIKKYILFMVQAHNAVKYENYDIIYVHYIKHTLLPLSIVKRFEKPLIINAHGSDIFAYNILEKFILKIVKNTIKKADLVVVPSYYFKEMLSNQLNINKNGIFISPSAGINRNVFKPIGKKKKENFTIGYVSRIDDGKGWDTFVDAINVLTKQDIYT